MGLEGAAIVIHRDETSSSTPSRHAVTLETETKSAAAAATESYAMTVRRNAIIANPVYMPSASDTSASSSGAGSRTQTRQRSNSLSEIDTIRRQPQALAIKKQTQAIKSLAVQREPVMAALGATPPVSTEWLDEAPGHVVQRSHAPMGTRDSSFIAYPVGAPKPGSLMYEAQQRKAVIRQHIAREHLAHPKGSAHATKLQEELDQVETEIRKKHARINTVLKWTAVATATVPALVAVSQWNNWSPLALYATAATGVGLAGSLMLYRIHRNQKYAGTTGSTVDAFKKSRKWSGYLATGAALATIGGVGAGVKKWSTGTLWWVGGVGAALTSWEVAQYMYASRMLKRYDGDASRAYSDHTGKKHELFAAGQNTRLHKPYKTPSKNQKAE